MSEGSLSRPLRRKRSIMASRSLLWLCVCVCVGMCAGGPPLREGSACSSDGASGKCMALSKCASAATSQVYLSAGYPADQIAKLPERCSAADQSSDLVCCTDCENTPLQHNYAVAPSGQLVEKKGPKALDKCMEYFQSLPYRCRAGANVLVSKTLDQHKKCHQFTVTVAPPPLQVYQPSDDVSKEMYPHMALLGYGADATWAEWLCSGAVVSERFILTAAHCLRAREHGDVTFVRVGNQKRSDPSSSWHLYKIKRVIPHPEYKAPMKYNDIALLETEKEIVFSPEVLPMCLDVGNEDLSRVHGSGWGVTDRKGEVSDSLKVIQLAEQPASDCVTEYSVTRLLRDGYNHTSMMCYKGLNGDLCQGDGGGPVQVWNHCVSTGVGVTSFGKGCRVGIVGVYSRVSHYLPWIESVVWP